MSSVLATLRRSDTLRPLTCMHSQAHRRIAAHLQLCGRAKPTQYLLCHTTAPHTAQPHSSEGDPCIKRHSMQLSMSAGPFVPPSAYAERIGSVAAPCHQLCWTRAASALVGATPNACTAPQRVDGFTPLLQSALQRTLVQCWLEVRLRCRATRGQRRSLRERLAPFLGKAKRYKGQCSSGGATRHTASKRASWRPIFERESARHGHQCERMRSSD